MSDPNTYSGKAALSICEALLLALNDAHVLPESEIMGILKDAAEAHRHASVVGDADHDMHMAVAGLISDIIAGGNSVRRT
ncbi:hypothetical protein SAMN04488117_109127 [Celeribacter baekdonensis]|uniref:Uncharacterized protein n=1 Tax=Celeribacter baekdonensis TaxID=875171 RepID=A0A1G7QGT5_9RHOB|nr:hypothetical protein [Celeribacter baekdonensis]SDF97731.1 hypothetical protein SAMN04488117_109127 [Celeribacter baekdonensis]